MYSHIDVILSMLIFMIVTTCAKSFYRFEMSLILGVALPHQSFIPKFDLMISELIEGDTCFNIF